MDEANFGRFPFCDFLPESPSLYISCPTSVKVRTWAHGLDRALIVMTHEMRFPAYLLGFQISIKLIWFGHQYEIDREDFHLSCLHFKRYCKNKHRISVQNRRKVAKSSSTHCASAFTWVEIDNMWWQWSEGDKNFSKVHHSCLERSNWSIDWLVLSQELDFAETW